MATEGLADAQDKIAELETRLEGTAPSLEVGSVSVRELEDARDEALEALDRAQWEMEKLKREHEFQVLQIKEHLREEKYERDLRTRDELIEFLRAKKGLKERCPLRGERGWGPELRRRVA